MNAALVTRPLRLLLDGLAAPLPELAVTGVESDSRRVVPGCLFLAARGYARHGLDFVDEALRRGAAAVAWEPAEGLAAPRLPVPALAVAGLAGQAGLIAARFWNHPSRSLAVIGITGTDGKTSTAHLLAQAGDRLGQPCAYFGTLGYGRLGSLVEASHTTPDPVLLQRLLAEQRDAGARSVAMEVSSHALHQQRVAGIEFACAVLTNVGRDHLDYHGDLEQYAAAKRRLFAWPGLGAAVLNGDDARGAEWAQALAGGVPVVVYGLAAALPAQHRYVFGTDLQLRPAGLRLDLRSSWGDARLDSPLLGRFNAYNLLAALAVLLLRDVPLQSAASALSACTTVPGRVEAFRGAAGAPLVVVDYAHTPQALAQVLGALRAHAPRRLVCVFGCGGDRDRGKRPLMGRCAAELADSAILTDDNPRSEDPRAIAAEVLAGVPGELRGKLTVEHTREHAITNAVRAAGAEDIVLVAGKGHEEYQIYGSARREYSDRRFVAQLLGQRDAAPGGQP